MGTQANVRSLEAIAHFRSAILCFQEDATIALAALRQELDRTLQFLDHDCPAHWRKESQACFDRVAEARTHLARRQMITVAGHRPECIEEKKALRTAKRDLEIAQEKLRVVRQWSNKTHRAADEYSCRVGRVEQSLNQGCPRIIALLERMLAALDSYLSVASASRENDAYDAVERTSAAVTMRGDETHS